ncbi:MAG: hypothetical protein ACQEWE_17460 [Bacillota bacterium]
MLFSLFEWPGCHTTYYSNTSLQSCPSPSWSVCQSLQYWDTIHYFRSALPQLYLQVADGHEAAVQNSIALFLQLSSKCDGVVSKCRKSNLPLDLKQNRLLLELVRLKMENIEGMAGQIEHEDGQSSLK